VVLCLGNNRGCIIINHPGTACHPSIEGNHKNTLFSPPPRHRSDDTGRPRAVRILMCAFFVNFFNKKLKIKKRLCSAVGVGLDGV